MCEVNAPPGTRVEKIPLAGPDAAFMAQALAQAARGLGRTAPNPPVGCVVVRGGDIVGRGFHSRAGEPHAEVFALREAGEQARGAAAYVTLEPCGHFGRTPPCADALIGAGVARVVVAALDPDPRVSGAGVRRLRAAGLDVTLGVLEDEATAQQAGFRSLVARGRPWVVAKYAMTLDGKIAALRADGTPEGRGAVTGEQARERVMRWRDEQDAIAVGSGTLLADDPALTTRGVPGGRDPRPVVFDRRARTPLTARVWRPGAVLVTSPSADARAHAAAGVQVLRAATLPEALRGLGRLEISSLLLEGGSGLLGAFLAAGLVDEVRALIAPRLLGAGLPPLDGPLRPMGQAEALSHLRVETLGPDVLISGLLNRVPRLQRAAAREE
ncbi:bifunctional diaminohydroxyphosphoribosylaminopyrimidine deaminase/5-amino-6-(5-phosphoribosylamino)uracil reductase RibD [Deinococcus metallilatus]|uniref:Riboflavin biosynthesis protein RibD n=2 Tax=Deinococcus metallilatus TaxID=1211322 RepID=A0ABR6N1M2_9DEIO|nr:bifunctional diaminohydroxyphosphoribosylaminopyrimidine deaminase/5-amino-6-(5-phosphoribosylamino)uracil reductase RibD [Deinococcus metallilatus]MBB5297102.1 diaminohydroxyphosphoribosylaminopyrimidine deaminase/5-amino-6-(5-phosphoribosylamino)uracil reductase [Deinococcus metallilatus]GMA17355.1 riboflavin biosynthesis protein RibD [Deinococcus metallilatus]